MGYWFPPHPHMKRFQLIVFQGRRVTEDLDDEGKEKRVRCYNQTFTSERWFSEISRSRVFVLDALFICPELAGQKPFYSIFAFVALVFFSKNWALYIRERFLEFYGFTIFRSAMA
jgi:hypothetical protein